MNNMSEIQKTEIDSQINKIILKYNDKLSYKEQENFKALIYDKNLDFESLMKILNDLYALDEENFLKTMESCNVIEQKIVPEVINEDKDTIDLNDFDDVKIEPIEIEEIEEIKENEVEEIIDEEQEQLEEVFIIDDEFVAEKPNTDELNELEKDTPIEIKKTPESQILPTSVRGYIDITLLVIVLNIVCGVGLWIMLNLFYNA